MKYVWNTPHADLERLPERSSFSKQEIEDRLDEGRYIIDTCHYGYPQTQHLIWDEGRLALIAVPVVLQNDDSIFIPTILPVNYGNGIAEWRRAEAEQMWLGSEYLRSPLQGPSMYGLKTATAWLTKERTKPSGYPDRQNVRKLLEWELCGPESTIGEESVLRLFRNRAFRKQMQTQVRAIETELEVLCGQDIPVIQLDCPGARRHIPLSFFLKTP